MHRIDGPGATPDNRFTEGDPAAAVPATEVTADWLNAVQEELAGAVVGSAQELEKSNNGQLLEAIKRLAGSNVKTLAAGSHELTAADVGLVLVDASGGAVSVTLPPAAELAAARFTFARVDTAANAATIYPAGSDTIDGAGSVPLATNERVAFMADGASQWFPLALPPQASQEASGVVRLADAATAQGLTDTERALTAATLGAAMNAHVLGMGQTWQDVTSSRSFDTTYTNTTGRAIFVSVAVREVGPQSPSLSVDGVAVGQVNTSSNTEAIDAQLTAIVPPASEYVLARNGTTQQIMYWAELR